MRRFQAINLLLVLLLIEGRRAQPTAAISPSAGYNASLDAQASFSFQCDARGADDIRWIVDSLPSSFQTIVDRGIFESVVMVVDLDTRSLSRSLSISRNVTNEHVTIICRADSFTPSATVDSDPAIFQVQGLLEAPSNLMFLETNDQCMRRINWGEPFSLDITDIEPDISHYNVCYSLRNADKSRCLYVNQTEFSFLNVSVPLLFTVSAVNVVGEGNSSSILYGGNGCAKTTDTSYIDATQVQAHVSYPFTGSNLVASFQFQQPLEDCQTACFPVYKIESSLLSVMNTTDHGIQIPTLVQYSQSSILLSLTVDSDLVDNERYSANISSVSAEGEEEYIVTVKFDTYDVQSVIGRAIVGGLELSCIFAEGSQAQSCTLSIYRILDIGMDKFIVNVSINRENLRSSGQVLNLELGEYVIREVAEVESDGQVTIHKRTDIIKLTVTLAPPATTIRTPWPASPTIVEITAQSTNVVVIVTGAAIVLLVGIIATATVFVVFAYRRYKVHHRNQKTSQVVYEEPYDWAVSRLPHSEPAMEQCPAYGVLTN